MIIEYIDKYEGNISCQIDEINHNNIMNSVLLLSPITEPSFERHFNIYLTELEVDIFAKEMNIPAHFFPEFISGIGYLKFIIEENPIIIPTFSSINEMKSYFKIKFKEQKILQELLKNNK